MDTLFNSQKSTSQPTASNVDSQNIPRGECSQCSQCKSYQKPLSGNDCDYCGCKPVKHVHADKRGPCMACKQCKAYQNSTTVGECDYCGCKIDVHQTSVSSQGLSPQFQPSSSGKTPTCKFPGCTKSVFVEASGMAHEYCGRTHAQEAQKLASKKQ
jgi:hypothetical protein